jgi:ParB/RepB/Spo0J family partition protein
MQPTFTITRLKHSELKPATYNRQSTLTGGHRSGFDAKSLKELADSIRQQGIMQPLIVRKHPNGKGYEIVAGERRWTAAGQVNPKFDVPVIVRDLTESQARELNTIENLQRVGLHPLEEASNYENLLTLDITPRHTHETIAAKIGKSPAFVYGRLKLLRAPALAQKASFAGKLTHSNLLLIARIPDPKQAHQATLEILSPVMGDEKSALDPEVEPLSFRAAKKHIQTKYMRRLKEVKFDPEDDKLVAIHWEVTEEGSEPRIVTAADPAEASGLNPKATVKRCHGGKCSDCPFLTGNLKALYPDVESSDVCTFTPCLQKKETADFKRRAQLAKEEGAVLLKDKQAERLFHQGELVSTEYVDLKAVIPGEKKKTWEQALGEVQPATLIQARDDQNQTRLLVPVADALAAAEAAKLKLPKDFKDQAAAAAAPADTAEQAEAERANRKAVALAAETEILATLRAKLTKQKPDADLWRYLITHKHTNTFAERHGLQSDKDLTQFLKKKTEPELRALCLEALLFEHNVHWSGEFTEDFTTHCKHFDVDWKKALKAADKHTATPKA